MEIDHASLAILFAPFFTQMFTDAAPSDGHVHMILQQLLNPQHTTHILHVLTDGDGATAIELEPVHNILQHAVQKHLSLCIGHKATLQLRFNGEKGRE